MLDSTANGQPWRDTIVSIVRNARETETADISLDAALENIRNGRWAKPVAKIRERYLEALKQAEKDGHPDPHRTAKDAIASLKRELPAVTFSGRFKIREGAALDTHSGFICAHIDKTPPEDCGRLIEQFKSDAHVQAAFRSPSGCGLKVLFAILPDAGKHAQSFLAVERHIESVYARAIDGQAKEPVRLCFVSNDPDIFIREDCAQVLEPLEPAPTPVPRDIDSELTAKCGPAYYVTKKGAVVINESYFVQRICCENLVFFEYDERRSYHYNPATGAWERIPREVVTELVRSEWERLTRLFNEPALAFKDKSGLLHALVTGIESHSGRNTVFKRLEKIIHCANGMLHITADGSWDLMPFSPAYYARNPIPIPWDPNATCPKFDALLEFALPPDDVSLFWRWFGSVLLTGNAAHRILLCVGKAHTAKSTLAEVVELVRGLKNCTALRTRFLHERFELGRLFGFSLLTAKDVPGDFLEEDGAQALKKLVGHDYIPGEVKGSMVHVEIYGDFDAMNYV
jgi:hypothetical protein